MDLGHKSTQAFTALQNVAVAAGLEKPRLFWKKFLFLKIFLRFNVERRPGKKFQPRKNILYTIPLLHSCL